MYLFSPSSQNHITYRGQITPIITIYTTKTTTTTSLNPKNLRSAMDPQQISQGRPHVLFSSIIFLSKFIFSVTYLIAKSFFISSTNVNLGLPLPFLIPSTWINSLLPVHQSLSFEHDQTISRNSFSSFHQQVLPLSLSGFPHFRSYHSIYFHLSTLTFSLSAVQFNVVSYIEKEVLKMLLRGIEPEVPNSNNFFHALQPLRQLPWFYNHL